MKPIKSERLKKLEAELHDLEQWLKLGLVPAKEIEKHKQEIRSIQEKINEEIERLKFLKESGELEEYITPKRPTARAAYTEMPTLPDIDIAAEAGPTAEMGFDLATEGSEGEASLLEEPEEEAEEGEEAAEEEEEEEAGEERGWEEAPANEEESLADEESYFSDRNRWRRGGIRDPDANDW